VPRRVLKRSPAFFATMAVFVAAAALLSHALVNVLHLPAWSQLVGGLVVLALWIAVVDRFFLTPRRK
jgi:hypothetical protein